ncbi:MAG: hypothetical protein RL338_1718 [Chloroflexota bacterium]
MTALRPPTTLAARLLAPVDRLLAGPYGAPAVLGVAVALFVAHKAIEGTQVSIAVLGSLTSAEADPARASGALASYYLLTAVAFALYLLLALLAHRGAASGHLRSAILALGVGLHVGAVTVPPSLSIDVLSYVGHGAVGLVVPGGTPYTTPSDVLLGTPVGDALTAVGWAPPPILSPYGPLWTLVETAVASWAPTVGAAVLALKLVALASALGSAWLVWAIVGLVRPRLRLVATLLFLWNPVVLVELAGEGHNDGPMVVFALLSLYLTLRGWADRALLASTLGVLVKYVPAILVPPQAVFLWRTATDRVALRSAALAGALGSAVLAVATFAPVWAGLDTFAGLERSGAPGGYGTLPGSLYRLVAGVLPASSASLVAVIVPATLFAVFVVVQSLRVRDARSLVASAAWISVAYLLLARGLYFPWYGLLPIALLALVASGRAVAVLVVVTLVARITAPLVDLLPEAYPFANAAFALTNLGSFATLVAFAVAWGTAPADGSAEETDDRSAEAPDDGPDDARDDGPVTEAPAGPPADPHPEPGAAATAGTGGLAALLARLRAAADDDGRPRSAGELLLLAALVAVPMLATAIALLPEVTIRIPSMNDDALHWLFIRNASEALDRGANLLDHWLPQIEAGVPQFLFYQHLAPLLVIALDRLTLGVVDLFDWFNVVRWLLLVTFPLTVLWSLRRLGFPLVAAAFAAGAAPLLSGAGLYGFDYDSYLWRGWGLFTQLLAMHLSFVVVATAHRAVTTGRGIAVAAVAFAALVLAHLIYAYMMAITLLVILVAGITRANAAARLVRLGLVGSVGAAISAYMWLPFLRTTAYLNATPYLQPEKYDSYGLGQVLAWLADGTLLDAGRAPVLTGLLALGLVAALLGRRGVGRTAAILLGVWLLLYAGRPTLGPLADLLPLSDGLLFHRFVGSVHLAAILVVGLGGAAAWALLTDGGSRRGLALGSLVLVLVLLPTIRERTDYYAEGTRWMERTAAAFEADRDAAAMVERLGTLPPGRIYAGLPRTYGKDLAIGDIPFYNLLQYEGLTGLPPSTESMSLVSDLTWEFDESSRSSYELFNVRWVVAPAGREMPGFLTEVATEGRYVLYEAPVRGYGEYVRYVDRAPVATQAGLLARNVPWVRSDLAESRIYAAYDYPSRALAPAGPLLPGCADGGTIEERVAGPDRHEFVVECSMESGFVIKSTFHPNWRVLVDGAPVETFMASPSYIGFGLPAGRHEIVATYEPTPEKTPLALAGLVIAVLAVLLRRRLDRLADRLLAAALVAIRLVRGLREAIDRQLERERLAAEAERPAERGDGR